MLNSVVVSLSYRFVFLSFCLFVFLPQCKMFFGFVGDDLLGWLVLDGLWFSLVIGVSWFDCGLVRLVGSPSV